MKVIALCALIGLTVAKPNGFYHQEYNYKTSSQSYQNNKLQHANDDEGYYSKDGDLEGRLRPKVNAHSQHREYVNPELTNQYGIGQTTSFGHLNAQDRLRSAGSIFDHSAAGFQSQAAHYSSSNLRHLTQNLEQELARELQDAVYNAHRRSAAYGRVVSQSQVQQDLRELEEQVRRNITMRLQEALREQYGTQGVRGGYSYSILNGHLQPTANYNNQELVELERQIENNLLRQLENQFQTHYHTEVHTSSRSSSSSNFVDNSGYYQAPGPAPIHHPSPIQRQPVIVMPDNYPALPTYPVQNNEDSITTIATRVQNDLNEHLNRLLNDIQARYFSEHSQYTQTYNFDTILAQLQQQLRHNITEQFENQLSRSYGYGPRNYKVEDLENLKRQIETNLITKLNRDFNRQKERYFETYQSHSSGHQYYQTHQPIYYPTSNINNYQYHNQHQQVDLSQLQRELQQDLSRQLQAALSQHQFRQSHAYSTTGSASYSPQMNYQASLQELTAELNRNLTRQLEASLAQHYHGDNYNAHMASLRSQLQNDLQRQLQQGLQQSYSRYSSWSSSSSTNSNYRPVRGFDQNLYNTYGGSSDLVAGEDCMYGDDPKARLRREIADQQVISDDEDLTQQIEEDDDLTQQVEPVDLTQQLQSHDDLTQQQEQIEPQSHYTSKLYVGPLSQSTTTNGLVRQRVHQYEQLNQNPTQIGDLGGSRRITVSHYTTAGKPVEVEALHNNQQVVDSGYGGTRRIVTVTRYTNAGKPVEVEDLHNKQQQEVDNSGVGYTGTRRVTVTRYTSSGKPIVDDDLNNQQVEDSGVGYGSSRRGITAIRYTTARKPVEVDSLSNNQQQEVDDSGLGYSGTRRVTVTRYTSSSKPIDEDLNNQHQVEDTGLGYGNTRRVTVTRYTTTGQPLEVDALNNNQQVENSGLPHTGTRRVTITRYTTSGKPKVDTNQQAENVDISGNRRVTTTYTTGSKPQDVEDQETGGYSKRVHTITRYTSSAPTQSVDSSELVAKAQEELNRLRKQHESQGGTSGYNRRVTITRYTGNPQYVDYNQNLNNNQKISSNLGDGEEVDATGGYRRRVTVSRYTTPQKPLVNTNQEAEEIDNSDLTQQTEDLTQQSQDLTQQTQNIDDSDLTQQSQDLTQQTQHISKLQQDQQPQQQTYDADLAQQIEDQHISKIAQVTHHKQFSFGKLENANQKKPSSVEDLTQQTDDSFYSQSPTQSKQIVDDDQQLTQQVEVLAQQSPDLSHGKSEIGQQVDDDNDLTQQTQDLTQQTVDDDQDSTQQVQDLAQQSQDVGYGKLQVGQQTVDDDYQGLTQQVQDLTQQEDLSHGKLIDGQIVDEDLTQQTQDLRQQTEDDFGKLQTPQQHVDHDLNQHVHDLDIDYSKLQTGQQAQDLSQQVEDQHVHKLVDLTQQIEDDDLTQQSQQQVENVAQTPSQVNYQKSGDLEEAERRSQMLIEALRNKQLISNQNTNLGEFSYEPQPVYTDILGHQVQIGTTRQNSYNSGHQVAYTRQHSSNYGHSYSGSSSYQDSSPEQSQTSYGIHSPAPNSYSGGIHYGVQSELETNTESVQELEEIEPQRAHIIKQVEPVKPKSTLVSVEAPVEPEIEITTTQAPGFWSRLGNKIKDKAASIKEKIG